MLAYEYQYTTLEEKISKLSLSKQIIYSFSAFLKEKLDDYLTKHLPKVKVIRLKSRSGLITARLAGAKQATADVLIFLDSHTEANVNWLPPLLGLCMYKY